MDIATHTGRRIERRGAARRSSCLLGLGLLAASLPAQADWEDGFDGGFGAAWNFAATDDAGNPPSSGLTTFEVVDAGGDDHLRMAHSTRAFRDGGGGAADVFGWVDEAFASFAMAADVNADPGAGQQSVLGLLGRGDPEVGSAYLAAVDFASSRFLIARSDDLIDFQATLVSDDAIAIDPGTTYRIEFYLIGSTLGARLRDASSRALLSTISVVDTRFASGSAGLLVETAYDPGLDPVGPVVGTFDSVVVVPEPASMTLVVTGAIALAAMNGAGTWPRSRSRGSRGPSASAGRPPVHRRRGRRSRGQPPFPSPRSHRAWPARRDRSLSRAPAGRVGDSSPLFFTTGNTENVNPPRTQPGPGPAAAAQSHDAANGAREAKRRRPRAEPIS